MEVKSKEFTAKTVEEAVEEGLKEFGVQREDVEIEVLEEGKKKLFGYTKARVKITVKNAAESAEKEEDEAESKDGKESENKENKTDIRVDDEGRTDGERAVKFLDGLFEIMHLTAVTKLVKEDEKVVINVSATNTNEVIGKRGAMLDAVQTLAGAVANTGRDDYKRVVVDCENYRENREATLKKLASNLAQKATRLQKKIKLEPMNPYERRIIHAALSEEEGVSTQSEGKEPYRYIVIIPDNVLDPDRPAMPARTERGNDRRRGGYGKRDGRDGYKKPYGNRDGFKKPYNKKREGGFNGGSTEQTGGTSLKKSDFFGTFLGNSKDNND